jgi:hypothetical protein
MLMCPMAETLQGHDGEPLVGLGMVIPGGAFMALGVLIVVWPFVLPWLVAACLLAGGAMLLMATFMRGVGARLRRAGW